jgi:gliding motility-associated-like protein
VNLIPAVTLSGDTNICQGDTTTLIATGGGTYSWSTGQMFDSIVVNPSKTTNYVVEVTNNGCSKDTTIKVNVTPKPTPTITGGGVICGGGTSLEVSGGNTYLWSTGATSSFISVEPTVTTKYVVTVSNGNNCSVKDSATVSVGPPLNISACCDDTLTAGETKNMYVTPDSVGYTYLWSTGATTTSIDESPAVTTTYKVTVTNSAGCKVENTVTFTVYEKTCGNVFVPNVFSPNAAANTILYVRGTCVASVYFSVYDRWGNLVFHSNSLSDGWDGNVNSVAMDAGVYGYYLKATLDDGTVINKKGNIALIR